MKKNKIIGLFLCFVVAITFILGTKVFATNYGSGDVTLALDVSVGQNLQGQYTINSVTVNGNAWSNDQDRFSTSDGIYTIVVQVTSADEHRPHIGWGGNWNGILTQNTTVDNNVYTITVTSTDVRTSNPENPNNPFMGLWVEDEQQGGEGQEQNWDGNQNFDGKAYILWSCQSGGICMKHFDDIPNFDNGNSTFYKDTDIVDERTGEHFNVNAQYKGWSTDAKFNNWVNAYKTYKNINGDIDWSTVNPADMLGDPIDMGRYENDAIENGCTREVPEDDFHACVDQYVAGLGLWGTRAQLQPLGEPQSKNTYVSYGDRNFKVVIYTKDYKGISYGNLDDLHYYPAQWNNAYLRRDQFDISATTKAKPAKIPTILLENTINIKELAPNNYSITSLEALDVPEGAVTINKVNNEWKIVFNSNYYDNVVFKATDSNNGVSYFQIQRTTIDAWIRNEDNHPIITAEFFFDRTKSYTDFNLTAKILFNDGTEKTVKLTPVNRIDDGLGNITHEYEVDEQTFGDEHMPKGKGLKKSVFEYTLADGEDRNIKDFYTFAEYKSNDTTTYGGTFAGAGKGVRANIYHPGEDD